MLVCAQSLSDAQLFTTPWTVACQAALPMGFFRQKYWSGLPFLSPGDPPNPGIESESPAAPEVQVDSLPLSNCPYVGGPLPIC